MISEKPLTGIQEDEIFARVYIHDAKDVSFEFSNDKFYFELLEAIVELFSQILSDKIKIEETIHESKGNSIL
ncbi:MAG TPA: hypothetical protein ENH28_02265 [Euryarchaeota archaeon]|nr:hypothetical protein BMS3Bbin15_01213 [archaeon BMS3Bbin15]HDL14972.1 hypothetical protein [Euryarchaeota archaeon]